MKYVILISIIVLIILLFILIQINKKRAIKQVNELSLNDKLKNINNILEPFGFTFDLKQDIVISKNNSWQRKFGYMDLYDLNAPLFNMVMDAEPIYFDYNYKHYRIEFWKGQYGITTGAEVGIYVRDFNDKTNIYRSAKEDELLDISFSLYKNCYLFSRKDYTWWLNGFDVGNYSNPKELKMFITIRFQNSQMQLAFISGLTKAGYSEEKIYVDNLDVTINFCKPKNYKLNNHHYFIKLIYQINNKFNCLIYNYLTRYFNSTLDKLNYIRYLAPFLYRIIVKKCIICKKNRKSYPLCLP
jgi:hypothetical protein